MSDPYKPMSVEAAKKELLDLSESLSYRECATMEEKDFDNLIAAVRAECVEKHAKELAALQQANNCAADFVRRHERSRVLAKFRELADMWYPSVGVRTWKEELNRLIQSIETSNPNL